MSVVGRLAPGQVGDAGHQAAELRDLVGDPGEHLLAVLDGHVRVLGEHVDVDPQARERGAQLVAGVGDQAPLRVERPLQRAEHGVERGGEPAELVPAAHLDPPARVAGQRDLLRYPGEPGDRREPGLRHGPAEQGRDGHADRAERRQRLPDARDLRVRGGQRLGHLDGEAGGELGGQHHGPGAGDAGDGVEGLRLARRHVDRRLARREQAPVLRLASRRRRPR